MSDIKAGDRVVVVSSRKEILIGGIFEVLKVDGTSVKLDISNLYGQSYWTTTKDRVKKVCVFRGN